MSNDATAAGGVSEPVCAQCQFDGADAVDRFCRRCGGPLVAAQRLLHSSAQSGASAASLLSSLDASSRAALDVSMRLWDRSAAALEKSRASKHSARAMAAFFAELARIERNYANALAKLSSAPEFGAAMEANEGRPTSGSSLLRAWAAVKADVASRSRAHLLFAEHVSLHTEAAFTDLRHRLSAEREQLDGELSQAQTELRRAVDTHSKLRHKHDKLAHELATRGAAGKVTPGDVAAALDAVNQSQLSVFQAQNAYNRCVSRVLARIQQLELERVCATREKLLELRMSQSNMERRYLTAEAALYDAIHAIDPIAELRQWVDANHSDQPCPWANNSAASTPATAPSNPFSSPVASPSSAGEVPEGSSAAVMPVQNGANAASAHRKEANAARAARGKRAAHTAGGVHSASHLAALSEPPPNVPPLPSPLAPADLPFPTLELPTSMQAPPTFPWLPTMHELYPQEAAGLLPDISSFSLAPHELNRLSYDQLLLSTRLLTLVHDAAHRDTMMQVVRVQLSIPQSEHDMLSSAISSVKQQTSGEGASSDGDGALSEIQRRLQLVKHVRSSCFPNLSLYCSWVKRQLFALWMQLLWAMRTHMQSQHASSSASLLPLSQLKRTLQLLQLVSFNISSRIDLKLFHLGDNIAQSHTDMLAPLEQIEAVFASLLPHSSSGAAASSADGAWYAWLERVYAHLVLMGCVSGGDESALPPSQSNNEKDASDQQSDEDEDDDEEEEGGITLHPSHHAVLAALLALRQLWHLPPSVQHTAVLRVMLHLLYHQSQSFDGVLLDAEGMVDQDADQSLVPLLHRWTTAICGQAAAAEPEVAAALPPNSLPPSSLSALDAHLVAFALRNFGFALSDCHRFPPRAVAACLHAYTDVARWLGVKDVEARSHALLQISSVRFYQSVIPVQRVLSLKPSGESAAAEEADVSIRPEVKKMHDWSIDEWRKFAATLDAFMHELLDDFQPALSSFASAPSSQEGHRKNSASASSTPSLAEICLLQLMHCLSADVHTLLNTRSQSGAGIDDTLASLVSCVHRVQQVLLDPSHAHSWSSPGVVEEIARAGPNLSDIASQAMRRWIDVQKEKVESIRQRSEARKTREAWNA